MQTVRSNKNLWTLYCTRVQQSEKTLPVQIISLCKLCNTRRPVVTLVEVNIPELFSNTICGEEQFKSAPQQYNLITQECLGPSYQAVLLNTLRRLPKLFAGGIAEILQC